MPTTRVPALTYEEAPAGSRPQFDRQIHQHGRMTNMKRTLAHSPGALRAFMEWYPLRDEVAEFLGDRATYLFAHAISTRNECLICSTFFRRVFVDTGENPDRLEVNERDGAIVEFGRQLAADANAISDELYARLSAFLTPSQIVSLTAFGGLITSSPTSNREFSGKVAFVTGAAHGQGRAVALALAAEGAGSTFSSTTPASAAMPWRMNSAKMPGTPCSTSISKVAGL